MSTNRENFLISNFSISLGQKGISIFKLSDIRSNHEMA